MATFFIGFIFSFLGSLPLGGISLMVMQFVKERGFAIAIVFAFVSSVLEFIHVYPALLFSNWINSNQHFKQLFDWLAIAFFIGLGIFFLIAKSTKSNQKKSHLSWTKGILINILNPSAIPFWIFLCTWLVDSNYLSSNFNQFIFSLSACCGTFFALVIYAFLAKHIFEMGFFSKINFQKIMGFVFIILGLQKVYFVLI